MLRFENVPESVINLATTLQEKHFVELIDVKIKYLFDTKRNVSGGKICLGRCRKTDDFIKYFSTGETNDDEGYQYVITLDKVAHDNIGDDDRARLLRHELRHASISERDDGFIYRIAPHDIEDFVSEIELNADDPRWSMRIGQLVEDIYDQQAEMAKEQK